MMKPLTPREREVAELVAKGFATKHIAAKLGVSPRTVEDHIQTAARRIGGDTTPRNTLLIWFYTLAE